MWHNAQPRVPEVLRACHYRESRQVYTGEEEIRVWPELRMQRLLDELQGIDAALEGQPAIETMVGKLG